MTDHYQRITDDPMFDLTRPSHELRYRIANGFVRPGDRVLDAACGSGYGRLLLGGVWSGVDNWDGVDRMVGGIQADLETWQPDFRFDVFVGLETIEHLADHSNYLDIAAKARKWVIISTPIVPTKRSNPYHLHDFTVEQVEQFLPDHYGTLIQGKYGIFIWRRPQ